MAPAVARLLDRMQQAGEYGVLAEDATEQSAFELLIDRGVAHPIATPCPADGAVAVVVPAYGRPQLLARCLGSLASSPVDVLVVDDASPDAAALAAVVAQYKAQLHRHETNQGAAGARNTGLGLTEAPLVAFVDSDCVAPPGWLDALVPLFDEPRVGAVAPRVLPRAASARRSLLASYEASRSSLDMGRHRRLVRPGAALGFVPSAALVVRRAALGDSGFDPQLRLGEDVDLIWRLAGAGWQVRYEPTVTVEHEPRLGLRDWAGRRFAYGTSAAALDRRHPGRLVPADVSVWSVAVAALLVGRRRRLAVLVGGGAAVALGRRLRRIDEGTKLGAVIVGKGFLADSTAIGHALRREWWPVGWLALACASRSRTARLGAAAMLAPLALEWVRERPDLDPVRYSVLRLLDDAAYGAGVLTSALRWRRPRCLLPRVRVPSRAASS